ncbi:DUF3568 family protein [Candidatus Nitrospira bockiana]
MSRAATVRTPAVWAATLVLAWSVAGCAALLIGAAGGTAGAVYVLGKLKEEVNQPVPVVHEATVQALKDLEVRVVDDKADKLTARTEGELADGRQVWIDLQAKGERATELTIRVGVMGDEARSRRILEAITRRLPAA